MMKDPFMIEKLAWEKSSSLVPAIVQDFQTQRVLMLAYMNPEALKKTLDTGIVTFYSRSRQSLWTKGETSGNYLKLKSIQKDCDEDTLLIQAEPQGPACHLGTESCFSKANVESSSTSTRHVTSTFLGQLEQIIADRYQKRPEGSYTTKLFEKGLDRIAQKVGEEGVEVVIAAKNEDTEALKGEVADLIFHTMVLMQSKGISLQEIIQILENRHRSKESTSS